MTTREDDIEWLLKNGWKHIGDYDNIEKYEKKEGFLLVRITALKGTRQYTAAAYFTENGFVEADCPTVIWLQRSDSLSACIPGCIVTQSLMKNFMHALEDISAVLTSAVNRLKEQLSYR